MVLLKKMFFRISNCGTSLKKHEYKTLNQTLFFEVLDNRQRMRGFDPALANVELWKLSYFCADSTPGCSENNTNVRKSLNCSLRS